MFASVAKWFVDDKSAERSKVIKQQGQVIGSPITSNNSEVSTDLELPSTAVLKTENEANTNNASSVLEGVEDSNNVKTLEHTAEKASKEKNVETNVEAERTDQIQRELEEATALAMNTAKEWGSSLYKFAFTKVSTATEQIAKAAKQVKATVEEKTIPTPIVDIKKEHSTFVNEKKQREKQMEAGVPPWAGYIEEKDMKKRILALSYDRRNFLRNPPNGVEFEFQHEAFYATAIATLKADPKLRKLRFELVPRLISEENFWRNYFYRVTLIKQSVQLASLTQAQQKADRTTTKACESPLSADEVSMKTVGGDTNVFVSDSCDDSNKFSFDNEKFLDELNQLKMEDDAKTKEAVEKREESNDGLSLWERELRRDLLEFEVICSDHGLDDGNKLLDDSNLEDSDIHKQIADAIIPTQSTSLPAANTVLI